MEKIETLYKKTSQVAPFIYHRNTMEMPASIPIFGFQDANSWERRGNFIVGRAKDSSYKEKLRSGIPIEYFLELDEPAPSPKPRAPFLEPKYHMNFSHEECIQETLKQSEEDYYCETYLDSVPEPQRRNHRGTPRVSRKGKPSKYISKAQRRKIRFQEETLDEIREDTDWDELCNLVIYNDIWFELRHTPLNNSSNYSGYGSGYKSKDCDRIIHRFRITLDPSTHSTSDAIRKEWKRVKPRILADFVPLKIEIPRTTFRYFDRNTDNDSDEMSQDDDWDDDWEWSERGVLNWYY
jgi:hypothetical protein